MQHYNANKYSLVDLVNIRQKKKKKWNKSIYFKN